MANGQHIRPEDSPDVSRLFENVAFTIVPSRELDDESTSKVALPLRRLSVMGANVSQLSTLLVDHGASEVTTAPGTQSISLHDVTHIISSTSDFPQYHDAVDAFVSVVTPQWVSASLSKHRLAQLRQYSPDPRLFFSGVTVCCVDLPTGDVDAITGGVVAMGGQYSGSLTRFVTHIVALTDDNEKCQKAMSKGLRCKIVLPHWYGQELLRRLSRLTHGQV